MQVASLDGGQTTALVQNGQVLQQLQPQILQQATGPGSQGQPQQIQIVQHVAGTQVFTQTPRNNIKKVKIPPIDRAIVTSIQHVFFSSDM